MHDSAIPAVDLLGVATRELAGAPQPPYSARFNLFSEGFALSKVPGLLFRCSTGDPRT